MKNWQKLVLSVPVTLGVAVTLMVTGPNPPEAKADCNCGGPAMIWKGGPVPGAPAVLVESWKIDWEWCWRDGDQGLNWYLDPPR